MSTRGRIHVFIAHSQIAQHVQRNDASLISHCTIDRGLISKSATSGSDYLFRHLLTHSFRRKWFDGNSVRYLPFGLAWPRPYSSDRRVPVWFIHDLLLMMMIASTSNGLDGIW